MDIRIITKPITCAEAKEIAKEFYVDMVKGVVDVKRGIVALGGEWHIDANVLLTAQGSKQRDVWGFNLHFNKPPQEQIEYISLINIRPADGNFDMVVQDESRRNLMRVIIEKLIV
ncbi:MAG: DUF5674 family protein [bacterium]|nr:DUF5674 family protein [bacterium]